MGAATIGAPDAPAEKLYQHWWVKSFSIFLCFHRFFLIFYFFIIFYFFSLLIFLKNCLFLFIRHAATNTGTGSNGSIVGGVPSYLMVGGLVFLSLSKEYLDTEFHTEHMQVVMMVCVCEWEKKCVIVYVREEVCVCAYICVCVFVTVCDSVNVGIILKIIHFNIFSTRS